MIDRATHHSRAQPTSFVRVISESESHVEFVPTQIYTLPRGLFETAYAPLPPSEAEREEAPKP